MPRDRLIALMLIAPAVVGAVFSLVRFAQEGGDVPHEAHYKHAAKILEQQLDDDTGLVLLPAWTQRPLAYLDDGKQWEPGDDPARQPYHRYANLMVLVENDGEQGVRQLQTRFGAQSVKELFKEGPLRVLDVDVSAEGRATYDFRDALADAVAVRVSKAGEQPCTRRGAVLQCSPKDRWMRVAKEWHLVTENGREVLWAHPPPSGEKVRLRYDQLQLGKALVLSGGFTRRGSDRAKAPVRVRVLFYKGLLQGQPTTQTPEVLVDKKFPVAFNWTSQRHDVSAHAGQKGAVVFEVSSTNHSNGHFGFDAMLVDGGGPFTPPPPLPPPAVVDDAGVAPDDTTAEGGQP